MNEIRVEGEGGGVARSDTHPRENLEGAERLPPGHALPGGAPARTQPVVSDDPEAARAEIEQTRARMSETIDEIEDVLVRKRDRIQDRLDVLSPVRERPIPSAGIAFGVGLVLGLLTGGEDEEEEEYDRVYDHAETRGDDGFWRERSAEWEGRARRLLRIAREQEDEIRDLEERYGSLYTRDVDASGFEEDDDEGVGALRSVTDNLRETMVAGVTGFLTDALRQMTAGRSASAQS